MSVQSDIKVKEELNILDLFHAINSTILDSDS